MAQTTHRATVVCMNAVAVVLRYPFANVRRGECMSACLHQRARCLGHERVLLGSYLCKQWEAVVVHHIYFLYTQLFLNRCASWEQGDELVAQICYVAGQPVQVILALQCPGVLFEYGSLW